MIRNFFSRPLVYVLCFSFLLMMNGFHQIVAEAKEAGLPIGEMVSQGEVKIETRENVWKNVEPSFFPIFKGAKIKTEKGTGAVTLAKKGQIEIGPNTLLSFGENERLLLTQGRIDFRIVSNAEIDFKIGNLSVMRSRVLQASKSPVPAGSPQSEIIGSIQTHSNGAVTVKSLQGSLTILSKDHVVLAALSPKESVTLPSTTVKGAPPVMVAQVGEVAAGETASEEFLGLGTWTWVAIGGGVAAIAGIAIAAGGGGGGGGHDVPICP
jgi:hypothetical protein